MLDLVAFLLLWSPLFYALWEKTMQCKITDTRKGRPRHATETLTALYA